MSAFVQAEMDKNEPLDPLKLKIALERLLNYLIQDLGASPWNFVLVWYLSHLLVTELESAIQAQNPIEAIPLARTLQDVLEQSTARPSPVLNTETVLETSRKLYANNHLNPPAG